MSRIRRRDRISAFAGVGALAFAVLAVGGAFRWVQGVVAIILVAALASQLTSRRRFDARSPLLVLIGLATVFTAIQLIPLPADWVAAVDPTYETLRTDGTAVSGVDTWTCLSMDPAGTLRSLAFFVILFATALISLRLSTNETGRHGILAVVASICGFVALTVGVHEMFGATSLFGIYTPQQANPPVLGPLLNPNHLGSLMAVGTVLSIGLFLYHRQSPTARTAWATVGIGCGIVTFASLSRGAVVALFCGVAVTLGMVVAQRLVLRSNANTRPRFLTSSLPLGIVVTCGLILVVYTSAGNVTTQLSETSLQEVHDPRSKFQAWKSSEQMIEETPWVGVGRGAFEPTFTRVHPATAFASVSHLENEYIQTVVDWGIPAAIVLALAMAWLCVVALRRWRDGPLSASALGALAVVAIQSNVDFGVELVGLALPVTAIAATLTYVPMRDAGGVRFAFVPRAVVMLALLASAAVLFMPITTTVAEDHDTLADPDLVDPADVTASLGRHPLDYIGYATAAERELDAKHVQQAVHLLNHALALHPTHPGLHRLVARILHRAAAVAPPEERDRYESQAALEYAASLRGTVLPQAVLDEIAVSFQNPADAVAAIPTDYRNIDVIVRALGARGRLDLTMLWLDKVLVARPRELGAANELYALAHRKSQWEVAERAARIALNIEPSTRARGQLATALYAQHKWAEVTKLVDDVGTWRGQVKDITEGWFMLCNSRAELDPGGEDGMKCFHHMEAEAPINDDQQRTIRTRLDELRRARTDALDSLTLPALVDPDRWPKVSSP